MERTARKEDRRMGDLGGELYPRFVSGETP
jgi:hypothetical protein